MTKVLRRGIPVDTDVAANGSATFTMPSSVDGRGIDVAISMLDTPAGETEAVIYSALDKDDDEYYHDITINNEDIEFLSDEDFTITVTNLVARFIRVTVTAACRVRVMAA